jgi:asparagine synthase (glutamine-hydrolysing)
MCGIGGIVRFNKQVNDIKSSAILLNKLIAHRGPDGEGYLLHHQQKTTTAFGNDTPQSCIHNQLDYASQININEANEAYDMVLLHRRLSIIDLNASGHQPMCIDEGNLWITFNGEIYNYIEIRKELQDKGCIFKSESDTEVVLFAYKVWGKKCLQKFNGMWAFVIFDKTKNILFGARDLFGVKPFYYYKDKDVFAFASEQKALVKMPFIQTGIRQEAVYDYFVKGEIEYETLSFFKHINELFPAHSFELHVNTGNFNTDRYYVLETNARYESYDEEKFIVAKDRVAELLNNAIKLRLRADVSVGACLSGGIDSSAIVSLMDNLNNESGVKEKINLFTASFNDITVDESPFAARVAEQTNSAFYRVFPNSDELISDLENLIYCQDVPIWSTSTYAQYRVMQKAKETGVKVVLDGQGGDELFGGYHSYMYNYWAEILKQFKLGKLHSEMKGFLPWHLRYSFFAKQHLRFSTIRRLPAFVQYQINRNYFGDLYYFNSQFLNENKNRLQSEPVPKNLNKMLVQEFTNTRLKAYLKCEDRCSMWHSVESRTPFADDINLIEFAFQLPSSYKIKNGVNKHILRESMRGVVPDIILNRKDKMGFATPNSQWIKNTKDAVRPYFDDSLKDYFDMHKIDRDFDQMFSNNLGHDDTRTFKFIAFAVWKKVFGM